MSQIEDLLRLLKEMAILREERRALAVETLRQMGFVDPEGMVK